MSEISPQDLFNQALQHHQSGQLDLAWKMYLQLLNHLPDHPDILRLMGLISIQTGQFPQAEQLLRKALSLKPHDPRFFLDLADALVPQGKIPDAAELYQKALSLQPDFPQAHYSLGNLLMTRGLFAQAAEHYQKAIALQPDFVQAIANLASALHRLNRLDESLAMLKKANSLHPDNPQILLNFGVVLSKLGRLDDAIASTRQTIALDPSMPMAHYNLGQLLAEKGLLHEALDSFQHAISLNPNYPEAYNEQGAILLRLGRINPSIEARQKAAELAPQSAEILSNLGCSLCEGKRIDEAVAVLQKALQLNPLLAPALCNLGIAFLEIALHEKAIQTLKKSVALDPHSPSANSSLLMSYQFAPHINLDEEKKERALWNQRHAANLPVSPAPFPHRSPDRLRVAFISPDLHFHPVGRFMLPLLANLDRSRFFTICCSDSIADDDITRQLRSNTDLWIDSAPLSHDQLDRQLRQNDVHILIDLAAHLAGNRLPLFARKPAPVQISWLAYCGSTGLSAMDFRISDPYMDPGQFDAWHTEKTLRLPHSYWCYPPPETQSPLSPPPLQANGFITFGCLNAFCKISPQSLECWAQMLQQIPQSRLKLHAPQGSCRQRVLAAFQNAGVDPSRILFQTTMPREAYFNAYREIDIALDPSPYNGGTTSLDALWMGVPLITLVGDRPVGRAGLSILSNLDLTEFAAHTPEEYVQIAVNLANTPQKIALLRSTLRDRMQNSPLMHAKQFADDFAQLLDQAWKQMRYT